MISRSKLEQQADQLRGLREAAVDSNGTPDSMEGRLQSTQEQCRKLEGIPQLTMHTQVLQQSASTPGLPLAQVQELTMSNASLQQECSSAGQREAACRSELETLQESHLQELTALQRLVAESREEHKTSQQQIGKLKERERELQLQVEKLQVCEMFSLQLRCVQVTFTNREDHVLSSQQWREGELSSCKLRCKNCRLP